MRNDVLALICVLRHFDTLFVELEVTQGKGHAEFVDLVAGVVDIKLTLYFVASPIEGRSQTVADRAAAGIADVHWAGRIGGNEFHQHLFA